MHQARLQERFPTAKIVRAFSSIRYLDLQSEANKTPPAVAVPYSTDFDDAKNVCEKLIRDAGFAPFDLGPLNLSKPLDPGGSSLEKPHRPTDSGIFSLLIRFTPAMLFFINQ